MNDIYFGLKELIERGWFEDIKSPNRNQLAAMAMQGMMANPEVNMSREEMVKYAYAMAEAMIAEREK